MQRLDELIAWFETLSPDNLHRVGELYAAGAEFKDPFNEVRGPAAIENIFRHMFVQVAEPRFVVTSRFAGSPPEGGAMLLWEFHFGIRAPLPRRAMVARGATHLRFDGEGRVTLHRDYWDAAEELYAKLPLLGCLMRGLQRMARA